MLKSIAAKHEKTVAQVILRGLTQRGIVAVSKSVRPERMAENFNALDFELGADEMAAIKELDVRPRRSTCSAPPGPELRTSPAA